MITQQTQSFHTTPVVHFMPAGNETGLSTVDNTGYEKPCLLHGHPSHAVVIGLGRTGLATAVFLSNLGLQVDVYDSSDEPALSTELSLQAPDVKLFCGSLVVERWSESSMLVVSPGVPLSHPDLAPLLDKGVRPLGDIELFAQCVQSPVIAITGSNGKSTVTVLLGEILKHAGRKVAVGGNIGVPILELLDDEKNDIYVLELSSFQLETTWTLNPVIATVLNISADHLDRYAGLDEYIASKAKVFNGNGKMLLNADDPVSEKLLQSGRETIYFGSTAPASEADYGLSELDDALYLARGNHTLMSAEEIHLAGQHNLLNVLAAWALANNIGIEDQTIKEAVAKFSGLAHRMEWLTTVDDVGWINDSKGTNVGATVAAINGLNRPVILIAGGIAKDADFSPLCQVMAEHVKAVILIGRDAEKIAAVLTGIVTIIHAADMQEAVLTARASSQAGDLVLLSPACASFDMYKNFEHRGDEFRRCVEGLR